MERTEPTRKPVRRQAPQPLTVTWLALGVLIIAILHWIRFQQAVSQWDFLSDLPGVSPLYQAGTGIVWGVVSLLMLYGLWRGLPAACPAMFFYALAYSLYVWIDLLWVAKASLGTIDGASLPFKALATAAWLLFTAYALLNRKAKAYFDSSR